MHHRHRRHHHQSGLAVSTVSNPGTVAGGRLSSAEQHSHPPTTNPPLVSTWVTSNKCIAVCKVATPLRTPLTTTPRRR